MNRKKGRPPEKNGKILKKVIFPDVKDSLTRYNYKRAYSH